MLFDELDSDDEFMTDDGSVDGGLSVARESALCVGHQALEKQLLALAESGRMPHALIFSGPEGIGKATMAFRLTRYLFRYGKDEEDSGGGLFGEALPPAEKPDHMDVAADDPIFRQVAAAGHPDLMTLEREIDEKTGRRKGGVAVDAVRKVAPFLRMTASQGGWRIVIVDDADTMNRSAQSALLKILEEPPQKALLILITHRLGAMIPTIRSRCRVTNFQPLSRDDFSILLRKDSPHLSAHDLDLLYGIAAGSAGQALSIMEEGGLEAVDKVLAVLESWPRWNWPEIHKLSDSLGRSGQDKSYQAFRDVFLWMNEEMLRAKARQTVLPEALRSLQELQGHYSLEEWIEICETLKDHFVKFDAANLDKRQAVLGAFMIYQ